MSSPLLYNEFKHIGVAFADPQQVQLYDAQQGTHIQKERQLVERLGIVSNSVVVEFGCGTGVFAMAAAEVGAHVIAVDVSEAMLKYAQTKAIEAGLHNIEFVQAGFLSYQHKGQVADFVVTKFAFHHLPDFWKAVALNRITAMLREAGTFYLQDVVFSFSPEDYVQSITDWISHVASETGNVFSRADFENHVCDEFSTFGWVLEGLLRQAGFGIRSANYYAPTYAEYLCHKEQHSATK